MSYNILTIPPFDKQLKRLSKKYPSLNPNYALENVMKVKNTIKISTHGLFWMKKYINILIFKKGVSAYF